MNIFISYSTKSRLVVEVLATDLEAMGYNVWFDRKLSGGQDWWAEILQGIRHCNLFLFALTPEAAESHPCKLEYDYAFALNKRILPVMLSDINLKVLPSALQKLQFIDYRQQDKQQVLNLAKSLNSLPPGKALPKPLPPKPEMPLPPLTRLRDQIDSPALKSDEQRLVVTKLKEFLRNPETVDDARMLLRKMRDRDDLLARTEREISGLLTAKQPRKPKILPASANKPFRKLIGHTEAIFGVAYSPTGQSVLTGGVDTIVRLWDTLTGQEMCRFVGHTATVWSVAFAPNGRTALTASRDKTTRLWDIQTGRELQQFSGHSESVWGIAYAPDGHTILTGSFDKTARLWNVATGEELCRLVAHTAPIWGVAYAPDGKHILTASWDRTVRLWDVETAKEIRCFNGYPNPVVGVVFSPDGKTFLTTCRDSVARLWDVQTGKPSHSLEGHIAFNGTFSPDGKTVLTGGVDKTARLWDVATGNELRQFVGHSDAVTSVAFSPDGCTVLTGSADKTARLWFLKS